MFNFFFQPLSDGNKRDEKGRRIGGYEMGKSGGEHVGPVPNSAVAFVYEFQFLAFFAGEEIVKDETRRLQAPCSHLPAWKHLQWDVQKKKN